MRPSSLLSPLLAPVLFAFPPLASAELEAPSATEITSLIDQLELVDSPQTFYARSFRSTEFLPLDLAPLASLPLPPDTPPAQASFRAMVRLVEYGPAALPILLKHLDDGRPTATAYAKDYIGTMGPSSYLDFRSGDRRDESVIAANELPKNNPGPGFDEVIEDYQVTIGDICFTLVGMITNRSYYLLVDEFDAQLNSPTRSPALVAAVRAKWGPHPDRHALYQQLVDDLEHGEPRFANSAARRLLYYFPNHCDRLLVAGFAKRLGEHSAGDKELTRFIRAIGWSSNPRIASTLRRFLRTAEDPGHITAAAAVYGNIPDTRGQEQLALLADRLKQRRDLDHVKASRVILGLNLLSFPEKGEDTIRRFLDGAGPYGITSALVVCGSIEGTPVQALAPLLANTSADLGDSYLINGKGARDGAQPEDYLPYRVCDRAYETICHLLGDEDAVAIGTRDEMDLRIEKLSKRLAGDETKWKFTAEELHSRASQRGDQLSAN